jgi:hypothetical protein
VSHTTWHIVVLSSTLLAAAGLAIVALAPLVFDEPPPGLTKARPWILALIAGAAVLLLVEWLGIH